MYDTGPPGRSQSAEIGTTKVGPNRAKNKLKVVKIAQTAFPAGKEDHGVKMIKVVMNGGQHGSVHPTPNGSVHPRPKR